MFYPLNYYIYWYSFISFQLVQFLGSFAFLDYLERRLGSDENSTNLLEKLQDAVGRGQDAMSILPKSSMEREIITIAEPEVEESGTS